jgi:PAS domain S-box-containing protein
MTKEKDVMKDKEQFLYRLSADRSPYAEMWGNDTGRIIYVNQTTIDLLGYSRDELLDMKITDIDASITPENWHAMWKTLEERGFDSLESEFVTKTGNGIPVEIMGNYVEFEGKGYICASARDITSRRQKEKNQVSLFKISEAARSAKSLDELFGSIHEIISELMPAKDNFYIALYDEENEVLSFPYFVDEYDEPPGPEKLGRGLTEYVLRTGEPLLASPDVFAELEKQGEVESIGPPSIDWLGVPLRTQDRTIGVLVVQTYTEGFRYTEEEKDILVFITEQITNAILRQQTEEALREREELYRSVVENSQNGVILIDDNYHVLYTNDQMIHITGLTNQELEGMDFRDLLGEAMRDTIADRYRRRQRGEDIPSVYDFPYVRLDGKELWLELSSAIIKDIRGRLVTVVQVRDITESKTSGELIKASLQEKEILLREIHHRVKNNLQIISSLLNLQSQYIKDETALEMFRESRLRIRSMAMVHEKLYKSQDLSLVDFGDYIQSLAQNLFQVYGITPDRISLRVKVHDLFLDINTAIPCGLLVSELISNALKHAFPDNTKGEISVSMYPTEEDTIRLEVSDNGVGVEKDLDLKKSDSFGLQLVDMLTEQLQGTIKIKRDKGTAFVLDFKELSYG